MKLRTKDLLPKNRQAKHHCHPATLAMPPEENTEKKGGWVYAIKPTLDEKTVIKSGFPWVSTSKVTTYFLPFPSPPAPAAPHLTSSTLRENPLGYHSHNSRNTHLVLTGKIAFFHPGSPRRALPPNLSIPDTRTHETTAGICERGYGLFTAKAGEVYRAELVECRECQFVEGHEELSPTTRDRFISRGKIRWDDRAEQGSVGKMSREVADAGDVTASWTKKGLHSRAAVPSFGLAWRASSVGFPNKRAGLQEEGGAFIRTRWIKKGRHSLAAIAAFGLVVAFVLVWLAPRVALLVGLSNRPGLEENLRQIFN
jgi:hypothetical protein